MLFPGMVASHVYSPSLLHYSLAVNNGVSLLVVFSEGAVNLSMEHFFHGKHNLKGYSYYVKL